MKVPFVDLRAQHDEVRAEIETAIADIIDRSAFIGGEYVSAFEKNFAAFCGARHSVACANGTDALKLALMAAGVRPGDEVITVPHTFIATVEAITMAGAHPALVDIDGPTYNMSALRLAEFLEMRCSWRDGKLVDRVTGRPVTAVLPVHLYGLPVDAEPIMQLAEQYGLALVEDACQAHGALCTVSGEARRAGTLGQTAAFSFYPGKNLGAMGEGGAVTTNDSEMDRKMRILRDHGQVQKYVHESPDGWNSRLDALQCAVLDIKLSRLQGWNDSRRRAARWYQERLAGYAAITLPVEPQGREHVYHLYVVRVPHRDVVQQALAAEGIGVGLHYPVPLHLQAAYRHMGWNAGDFPETEAAASSIISLPMFPHITEQQVDRVCEALVEAVGRS